jgi:hypothetical protein
MMWSYWYKCFPRVIIMLTLTCKSMSSIGVTIDIHLCFCFVSTVVILSADSDIVYSVIFIWETGYWTRAIKKIRLIRSLKKFIFRYQDLVEVYSVSAETIINDVFSQNWSRPVYSIFNWFSKNLKQLIVHNI